MKSFMLLHATFRTLYIASVFFLLLPFLLLLSLLLVLLVLLLLSLGLLLCYPSCVEVHVAAALGFMDGFSDLVLNRVVRLVPDFLA